MYFYIKERRQDSKHIFIYDILYENKTCKHAHEKRKQFSAKKKEITRIHNKMIKQTSGCIMYNVHGKNMRLNSEIAKIPAKSVTSDILYVLIVARKTFNKISEYRNKLHPVKHRFKPRYTYSYIIISCLYFLKRHVH